MDAKKIIKDLQDITTIMLCLGDLQKAGTVKKAVDCLEELKAENEALRELLNVPGEELETYLKYERAKRKVRK